MKLAVCMWAAAMAVVASARSTTSPPPSTTTPAPVSDASFDDDADADREGSGVGTVKPANEAVASGSGSTHTITAPGKPSPLDSLKYAKHKREWHMSPVRMVHARVQSDDPALVDGRFVSSFGNGDLEKGYLSAMDNVNTASVEGALMYVQAEGINVNARAEDDRCKRKNNMKNIVFYEIVMVQTNETIAEFSSTWQQARDTFEYGPMVPMDGGKCTPENTTTTERLPKACLQFNGDGSAANLGPFVGGYIKDDDVRAPYPNTYWFSFPNTCPTKGWAQKTDRCRKQTRKGLCDIGVGPDGVQCTFAYDILGWIPIDDVVGITSITNKATNEPYNNFTEWCEASTKNNEFVADVKTGKMKSGLSFWKNPLDEDQNAVRAQKVVDLYNQLVSGKYVSPQLNPKLVKSFKPLPQIDALREANPQCYESVPVCSTNYGCRREGYSQLCQLCTEKTKGCKLNKDFKFPLLDKAKPGDDLADSDVGSGESSNAESSSSDDTSIESPKTPEEEKTEKKTKKPAGDSSASQSAVAVAVTVLAAAGALWTA